MRFFMRKFCCIFLIVAVVLPFSGCTTYDKEYISKTEYIMPVQNLSDNDKIEVSNFIQLSEAILSIIEDENVPDIIAFDVDYDGDPTADISLACKQLLTQNAICAYCVEDILYDVYRVVSYYEAEITVEFAKSAENEIIKIPFSGALKSYLTEVLENRQHLVVVLLDYCNYTIENIEGMFEEIYQEDPLCVPQIPNISVNMYSGSGKQKLYEISIDYGMSDEELQIATFLIDNITFPDDFDLSSNSDLDTVVYACSYLLNNCKYSDSRSDNTAYSAIICGKADSQGLSYAMVSLCKRLNLNCSIVSGQKNWKSHYWNIIRIKNECYHIDIESCMNEGIENGFLLNDDSMWKKYRWDLSSYPQCESIIEWDMSMFDKYIIQETTEQTDVPDIIE